MVSHQSALVRSGLNSATRRVAKRRPAGAQKRAGAPSWRPGSGIGGAPAEGLAATSGVIWGYGVQLERCAVGERASPDLPSASTQGPEAHSSRLDVCSTVRSAFARRPNGPARGRARSRAARAPSAGAQPAQLVDLVVGLELAPERAHQPPAHELVAALAIQVARPARARRRARSAARSPPRPRAARASSQPSPGSSLPLGNDQSS